MARIRSKKYLKLNVLYIHAHVHNTPSVFLLFKLLPFEPKYTIASLLFFTYMNKNFK